MKKKESFLLSKNQNINYLTALLYDPLKRVYVSLSTYFVYSLCWKNGTAC